MMDVLLSEEDLHLELSHCRLLFEMISNSDRPGSELNYKECLARLHGVYDAVRALGMFSRNECVDDVNTEDVGFVLVNYYIGILELKEVSSDDPTGKTRLRAVLRGKQHLEAFLEKCLELEMIDLEDRRSFLATQSSEKQDISREIKVGRFKRGKAAMLKLEQVNQSLAKAKEQGNVDDALERDSILSAVDCSVKNALDEIESADREIEILEHMASREISFTPPSVVRVPPPGKGLTITQVDSNMNVTRDQYQSNVFKQSWLSPTMSLEAYADIEVAQALEREEKERKHKKENPDIMNGAQLHAEGLDDDRDLADMAAKKDRDWDDYKDENVKGAGVTKRY